MTSPSGILEQNVQKKMTSRQKQFAIGLAVSGIVVASGGFGYYFGFLPLDKATTSSVAVQTENVVNDSATLKVFEAVIVSQSPGYERMHSYSGTVRSALRTNASFQRNGLVTRMLVDEGQPVTTGQPLAELDSRLLQAQRVSLEARLDQARALLAELQQGPREETKAAALAVVEDLTQQYRGSQLRLERSENLVQSNSISQQDYEQQLYETGALEARLRTAQSQLDELNAGTRPESIQAQESLKRSIESELQAIQYQIDDCLLTAPFSGMVITRWVDPGAVVAAGTPVLEIIDPEHLEVHIGIPRAIAERIRPGQTYTVRVGLQTASTTLRTVLPEIDSVTQTRRSVFDVQRDPEKSVEFVDGQLAQMEMPEFVDDPGFWIPANAITSDHSGLWSCLTLKPFDEKNSSKAIVDAESVMHINGTTHKQSIEILHQVDSMLFVRGTLKSGQILVSSGVHRLVAGQAIRGRISPNTDEAKKTEATQPIFTSQVPGTSGETRGN